MILRMYDKTIVLFGLLIFSIFIPITFTDAVLNVTSKATSQRLAEGGVVEEISEDRTHLSREHVINNSTVTSTSLHTTQSRNSSGVQTTYGTSSSITPVIEETSKINKGISKKNDGTLSVGEKNIVLNGTNNGTLGQQNATVVKNSTLVIKPTPSTTKAPVPLKPEITEHDYGYDSSVSNNIPDNTDLTSSKITNMETLLQKKTNRSNYVIPIVAVILSVPLVAIIISVLYKRGTDWWQHRNYRRMDFLIEGMYNN